MCAEWAIATRQKKMGKIKRVVFKRYIILFRDYF